MASDKLDSSQSSAGLNESWVELNMTMSAAKTNSQQSTTSLEKLLVDAQKESGMTSRNSSSGGNSLKTSHSPPMSAASDCSEELSHPNTDTPSEHLPDFVRNWSSRPEVIPPPGYDIKLARPVKRHPLSMRHSRVMKEGWLSSDNLPTLLATHTASFIIGASLVIWYFSKNSGAVRT